MAAPTLIIIPTYNEADNVAQVIRAVYQHLPPETCDLLVVDDRSPDGTAGCVRALQQDFPSVHLLVNPGRGGLGRAYRAGFAWGLARSYSQFIEMDADLSHDPAYLPTMLALSPSTDVVVGSRYVPGGGTRNWPWYRQLISRGGSLYARCLLGGNVRDYTGGFNLWSRAVLESIAPDRLDSDGYVFQIDLKYRAQLAGFRLVEFPIVFVERQVGCSKMSGSIFWEAVAQVWRLRGRRQQLRRQLTASCHGEA